MTFFAADLQPILYKWMIGENNEFGSAQDIFHLHVPGSLLVCLLLARFES